MTVTAASLKARWAEFSPTPDAVVDAALAEAVRRTDARVFGDRTDDAVALRACHLLSTGAFGQSARLDVKGGDGTTTYLAELQRLTRERAGGGWAAGQGPTGLL